MSLIQLPKTQFSGLEFSNIMEDIKNLIIESPDYNVNWDDFLSSNAGRMLTEIYAWITDQLATRIDWIANENFIGTATQRSSIIKLLKLIGYKFTLPSAARADVTIELSESTAYDYYIKPSYINGTGAFYTKTITTTDQNGNSKSFEALEYNIADKKFLYKDAIKLSYNDKILLNNSNGPSKKITFFEGQTKTAFFTSTTNQGQIFRLTDSPIINNSITVFLISSINGVSYEEELTLVDNFLESNAQRSVDSDGIPIPIPYIITVRDDNTVDIEFAPTVLISESNRKLGIGKEILVFYRIGGGVSSNISIQAINIQELVLVNGVSNQISYYNETEGIGGQDAETVEHAVIHAPLRIKTAGKAVTAEDYQSILSGFESILLAVSYGYNNIPSNYYNKYGIYPNPMEVVNFIILKKPGWENIPTNKYYLSNWGSLNVENRFNGLYYFNNGNFGNELYLQTNSLIASGLYDHDNTGEETFRNYIVLKTSSEWKNSLINIINEIETINSDLIASLTTTKYDKSIYKKITDIPNHFVNDTTSPYFYGDYLNSGEIRNIISKDINAYFISKIKFDTINELDISTNKYFDIHIDNRNVVHIDLSNNGLNSSPIDLSTIISTINDQINLSYGNGYAYQDFGILISNIEDYVGPPIENDDEQIYLLRISGSDYGVNVGTHQTYSQLLTRIDSAITSGGYTASFVTSHANITCQDIRIQRTSSTGSVLLTDSLDEHDLLDALSAAPTIETSFSYGDYSNVASSINDTNGNYYLKLTSPNIGTSSNILLERNADIAKDCALTLFGLDYSLDAVSSYECLGVKRLTIITRDSINEDFGDIIYEHGTINFSFIDPAIVYLNYIKEANDIVKIGTYFNNQDNFIPSDPEWKLLDNRIYNSLYILDESDESGISEIFDIDSSNLVLRFNEEETIENSIYNINNDYNLIRSFGSIINSINIGSTTFNSLTGSLNFTIGNNEITYIYSGITSAQGLCDALNTLCNIVANGSTNVSRDFATLNNNIITLKVHPSAGTFTINGSIDSLAPTFFSEIVDGMVDYLVVDDGDYYLVLNQITDSIDMHMIGNGVNIPDSAFYINYLTDKRHVFLNTSIDKVHTDEDDLLYFLSPYTIVGIENTFKHPIFSTFDVVAEVFHYSSVSSTTINENIQTALKTKYGLSNASLYRDIYKSEVINIIMNTAGVRYVDLSYFGPDSTNISTNQLNQITCSFDEIIVLSDNLYSNFGLQEHGINITYTLK